MLRPEALFTVGTRASLGFNDGQLVEHTLPPTILADGCQSRLCVHTLQNQFLEQLHVIEHH